MHDLVHSCSHCTRLPVTLGCRDAVLLVIYCRFYIVGEPKDSKVNRSWRTLCGWMSSDQWSHDFSDLVDFQPNWNTSSFVRSFAMISLLCCSNHLFERNRYRDIDRYRLQMKSWLQGREILDLPFVVQFIKLFCSSRLVIETLHPWDLRNGSKTIPYRGYLWIRTSDSEESFWSLSYMKASRSVITTKCTTYPSSYRPLSSMLVLARFLSAVFLNHIV